MEKYHLYFGLYLCMIINIVISCTQTDEITAERTMLFDEDWKFIKANPEGAEKPDFDDSQWRQLDLPHDWSIEDLPNQVVDSVIGPFSKASVGMMGTGYTVGGTAWYRKTFTIDKSNKNKSVYLQFDGIYMVSDIWVNGRFVEQNTNGYTSCWYDITSFLNQAGQDNIVAVKVQNEGINSRWYSGSGIYRHTWLTIVDPLHVGIWGIYARTLKVNKEQAEVEISSFIENTGDKLEPVEVEFEIMNPDGKVVASRKAASEISPKTEKHFVERFTIENPSVWSLQEPNLNKVKITVLKNGQKVDIADIKFGIRSIEFSSENGFLLNGENVILKGGCFHHDNGPLGAAAIDRAEERKIELIKGAGYNAIRCSHNPPSPYLLDVCDRLGILVIDEIFDMWEVSKFGSMQHLLGGEGGYCAPVIDLSTYFKENWRKDVFRWVLRDRNHPSIIMWSIGNEIPEAGTPDGLRIATELAKEVRKHDTRPVTEALVDMEAIISGQSRWDNYTPHMEQLDVLGYNYGYQKYETEHKNYPDRIYYASEFMPPLSFENWKKAEELPYVIGNFSWTAMDYIGESDTGVARLIDADSPMLKSENPMRLMMMFFNLNSWPAIINYQGDLDLIGNRKAASFYQSVVWRDSPLEMIVHRPIPKGKIEIPGMWGFPDEWKCWTWPGHEGEEIQVHVYSRSPLVKLELNGKVVGKQTIDTENSITATFEVPYEPGTLIARSYRNGEETASQTLTTAGVPVGIKLCADRKCIYADKNDLAYVQVEIVDADGNLVPSADGISVNFELKGLGVIAGVGNGNPMEPISYKQPKMTTFHGKCLVIIQPQGEDFEVLKLSATSEGLKSSAIEIVQNEN